MASFQEGQSMAVGCQLNNNVMVHFLLLLIIRKLGQSKTHLG